jgi:hypothetical protein
VSEILGENVYDHSKRDRRRAAPGMSRKEKGLYGAVGFLTGMGVVKAATEIYRKDVSCVYPIFHFRLVASLSFAPYQSGGDGRSLDHLGQA